MSTSPFVDHRPAPETKLPPFPCDRNARFPVRPAQGHQTLQVPTGWAAASEGFRRPGRLTSTHSWGVSDPTSTLGNPALLLLGRASVEENSRDDLGAGDPAPQPRSHVGPVWLLEVTYVGPLQGPRGGGPRTGGRTRWPVFVWPMI